MVTFYFSNFLNFNLKSIMLGFVVGTDTVRGDPVGTCMVDMVYHMVYHTGA